MEKLDRNNVDPKSISKELLSKIYDEDDNILFGREYTKGKVVYNYVKAEHMSDGLPFFVYSSISYDGIGNKDLPKDVTIMSFDKVLKFFTLKEEQN